jgi:hypothetical protein
MLGLILSPSHNPFLSYLFLFLYLIYGTDDGRTRDPKS